MIKVCGCVREEELTCMAFLNLFVSEEERGGNQSMCVKASDEADT